MNDLLSIPGLVVCWNRPPTFLGAFHFAEGFVWEVRFTHRRRLKTRVVWSRGCPFCRRDHPAVPAQSQASSARKLSNIGTNSDARPEHHSHRHGNLHCWGAGLYPKYRGLCVLVPPLLVWPIRSIPCAEAEGPWPIYNYRFPPTHSCRTLGLSFDPFLTPIASPGCRVSRRGSSLSLSRSATIWLADTPDLFNCPPDSTASLCLPAPRSRDSHQMALYYKSTIERWGVISCCGLISSSFPVQVATVDCYCSRSLASSF